jgi:hypothetical protein
MKDLIKKVADAAPLLGSALGGPLGGVQLDLQPLEAASYIYLNNYWHQIT